MNKYEFAVEDIKKYFNNERYELDVDTIPTLELLLEKYSKTHKELCNKCDRYRREHLNACVYCEFYGE